MDVQAEIHMSASATLSPLLEVGDTATLYLLDGEQIYVSDADDVISHEMTYTGVYVVITQEILDWYRD